jgi:hypothetical protein
MHAALSALNDSMASMMRQQYPLVMHHATLTSPSQQGQHLCPGEHNAPESWIQGLSKAGGCLWRVTGRSLVTATYPWQPEKPIPRHGTCFAYADMCSLISEGLNANTQDSSKK